MGHPRILGAAIVLLLGGILVVILAGSVLVTAIGWALFGIALVVFLSLAFLLVGESEDRDRLRNPRG